MKKVLSLAAMFAVLAYASPASAELKLGGDASMRMRGQFQDKETGAIESNADDLNFAYRLRLKGSADLGSGYFFKTLLTTETLENTLRAGGWLTVGAGNSEDPEIDISQLYFGRMMQDSHWMVGRLPLNSANNPIFDLALYPIPFSIGSAGVGQFGAAGTQYGIADVAVATYNMDRVYGINYGTKIGSGEANATLVVFDNGATGVQADTGDGMLNDGYALHLSYKDKIGDVTIEPQAIIALTNLDGAVYSDVSPNTFGANLTIPTDDVKVGVSAFYTVCDDENGRHTGGGAVDVEYSGYLLRLKGEMGNAMAWIDYNKTTDKTGSNTADTDYDNVFVWAQYTFKMHESAAGSFSLTPTLRYKASGSEQGNIETDYSRLRTELVATVTF